MCCRPDHQPRTERGHNIGDNMSAVPLRGGWTRGHASAPGLDCIGIGRRGAGDLDKGSDGVSVMGVGGVSVGGVRVGSMRARSACTWVTWEGTAG